MASARNEIANRIAAVITERGMTNPFGGTVTLEASPRGGKYYSVSFSRPRVIDGEVMVWSAKDIVIRTSRTTYDCDNEAEAIAKLNEM